ncbi:STM3941 family protein [Methylocystis parvus]|uniref:STM3941 family protein n=1 Tax=Methylocystis parvus TaxID=134 RepID=UPI003C7465BE
MKGEFAAYVGVPFFGVCGLFALYKLRDKRPLLVVDEYGIHDNSSALGVGLIRWSQINGFSRAEVNGQGMLAIHVSDPETLISAASPLKRPALRANLAMYGTPVFLSEFLLGLTSAQLLTAIKQYWRPEMSGSPK